MADASRASELIQRYLDHIASDAELAELEKLLTEQPAVADAFAEATRLDGFLSKRLGEDHDVASLLSGLGPRETRQRFRRRLSYAAALAAAVLVALGLWLGQSKKATEVAGYPAPQASGQYQLVGKPELGRGSELRTSDQPARLELGGYCRVEIKPKSQLRIEGNDHSESVYLQEGEVSCSVERGSGAFSVQSPVGTVTVTGTRFEVRLVEEKGEAEMLQKSMLVRVLAGAVVVTGVWGNVNLAEGQERTFAAGDEKSGTVVGIITEKGNNYIDVKAAGDKMARRYHAYFGKPNTVELVKKQVVGSRIRMEWKFHERLRVIKIEVLEEPKGDKKENQERK